MIKSDKFWDKVAAKYAKKPVPDEDAYKKKLSETQSFFSPDMRILEFGCGTGTTAIHHAPHVQHIDAVDVSENMINIGRAKALNAKIENINFALGTLHDFKADPESMDAVLGLNVVHLLPNRAAILTEVARILKPGGLFVSSTGCLGNSYLRFIKLMTPIGKLLGLMPDIFMITEEQLATEIRNSGFSIEKQWHYGLQDIEVFIIARKINS